MTVMEILWLQRVNQSVVTLRICLYVGGSVEPGQAVS